jgi:hypothetical protein
LSTNLADYYTSLIQAGQTNTQALQGAVNANQNAILAAVQSSGASMSDMMTAIGRFLGWQFYQIPNRYQAYIPGNLTPPGYGT